MARRLAAAIALAVMVASACGSEAAAPANPALLPPHERGDLAELFDPMVAPLGYTVTRAALIDRSTYAVDPDGGHLALYLAPVADISTDQFADDFVAIVGTFLPFVFEQWPNLNSFDVCQEPFGSTEETPPSLTIIDLTRDAAAGVAWGELDLGGIIALNERSGISVFARATIRESATWRQAAEG
jgi:hypothetical protein